MWGDFVEILNLSLFFLINAAMPHTLLLKLSFEKKSTIHFISALNHMEVKKRMTLLGRMEEEINVLREDQKGFMF